MISAIIVDDEAHNRDTLKKLISSYCPRIHIVDEAAGCDEAFLKIKQHQPQLVFLDVKMPGKSGLALLKMFQEILFEVIFVSAYDRYAIRAFEFNAIGYILKPVDVQKLQKTVEKAMERIQSNSQNNIVLHFIKTISDKDELMTKFSLHHNGKVVFIHVTDISHIESSGEHTTITLGDQSHYHSSKDLLQFEQVLEGSRNFIRVSKGAIVNSDHIKSYSKGEPCMIDMKGGQSFEVSRRRKTEILKLLKGI